MSNYLLVSLPFRHVVCCGVGLGHTLEFNLKLGTHALDINTHNPRHKTFYHK